MVESFVQNLSLFDEIHKMQKMGCILRAFEDVLNFTVWVFF